MINLSKVKQIIKRKIPLRPNHCFHLLIMKIEYFFSRLKMSKIKLNEEKNAIGQCIDGHRPYKTSHKAATLS